MASWDAECERSDSMRNELRYISAPLEGMPSPGSVVGSSLKWPDENVYWYYRLVVGLVVVVVAQSIL